MSTKNRIAFAVAILLSQCAPHAFADIFVGRGSGTPGVFAGNAISVFHDEANGNIAPQGIIGGDQSLLNSPSDIAYDVQSGALVVSDFRSQNVQVYSVSARGNVTPLRRFTSPGMGQPRSIAVIDGVGEYAVLTSLCCISYYPRQASGTVAALRTTTRNTGGLDNPTGLAYLPISDEIVVGDYYIGTDAQSRGELLFVARTASGTVAPTRRIAGDLTQLGSGVNDVEHDPLTGELYVLVYDQLPGGQSANRILVFAASANGNVAPLRQIGGNQTQLTSAGRIHFYAARNELLVNPGANSGIPAIVSFSRDDQGNVPPSRVISGANTGVTSSPGFSAMFGMTSDWLLRSGFE